VSDSNNTRDWDNFAASVATPAYLYSFQSIRDKILEIQSAFSYRAVTVLFATMANDTPEVLKTVSSMGVGACVNSWRHLTAARLAGIPEEMIHFTASGVRRDDMERLASTSVTVNLDSLAQIDAWLTLSGRPFGVRVNSSLLRQASQLPVDRLGVAPNEVLSLIDRKRCPTGLHVYAGTNFCRVQDILPAIDGLFEFASNIPGLTYLNLGGGVGIDYKRNGTEFNLSEFGSHVSASAADLNAKRDQPINIFFEPGRSLIGGMGVFVTEVTDIKFLNGTRYVTVDGSIAVFPRPFHNPDCPHFVRPVRKIVAGRTDKPSVWSECYVVGRTTFSRDILAKCSLPQNLATGDRLIFEDGGAYCESMMSQFLGQEPPARCFIDS